MLWEALKDSVLDTLKLIPFLFAAYLVMEFIEHKTSEKTQKKIEEAGKFGPVAGGILGAVPQCGFSAAAANLYAGRVISMGTLIAIFLSTSDEMLPILISERVSAGFILKVLLLKVLVGIVFGILIDFVAHKREGNSHEHHHHIHEMCEHDHCKCSEGILKSSVVHTIQITLYIFLFTALIRIIIECIGAEQISRFLMDVPFLGEAVAGLFGLIPNCAASVVITQMYLEGLIGFGSMLSGLLVGAGVGILVLFKSNRNLKENLLILGLLYVIGVLSGFTLGLFL